MKTAIVIASLLAAATADAGTLADALAKSDIKTLRAQRDDVAARCTLGAVYAKKRDLARAHLYLLGCRDAELPEEISASVARAARDVAKQVRASELSLIAITVQPEGTTLRAEISALPGDTFTAPATIWVPAGTHELTATNGELTFKQTVTLRAFSRTSAQFDASTPKRKPPTAGTVDMSDEGALEQESGPPPPVKRRSLMSDKYLGLTGPAGEQLADPLAYRAARYTTRPLWLGVRVGGGMFDDGASTARAGGAVAAAVRYRLAPRYFAAGRVDWSRRGGAAIDVLGASAGAGATLVDGTLGIALIAQLRGDLRLGDTMGVNTVGASGALGVEVALPATPITAGVRFEQGITELAAGVRDRALLVEVGVDWR